MISSSELRRIADANGAPEMDPLRRAADMIEALTGFDTKASALDKDTVAAAYKQFPDHETNPVHAGACRFAYLLGYRECLKQRAALSARAED